MFDTTGLTIYRYMTCITTALQDGKMSSRKPHKMHKMWCASLFEQRKQLFYCISSKVNYICYYTYCK